MMFQPLRLVNADELTLLFTFQKQPPQVTVILSPKAKGNDASGDALPNTKDSGSKPAEKKKKKKDPNAPKKPKSSFVYFSNAKRHEVKAANPEASAGEIVSEEDCNVIRLYLRHFPHPFSSSNLSCLCRTNFLVLSGRNSVMMTSQGMKHRLSWIRSAIKTR